MDVREQYRKQDMVQLEGQLLDGMIYQVKLSAFIDYLSIVKHPDMYGAIHCLWM